VARQKELKAQGKDLDVKVIATPASIRTAGPPTRWGWKVLEDAGPPRWPPHSHRRGAPRKIHARRYHRQDGPWRAAPQSKKGLEQNWEMSGIDEFGTDAASQASQKDLLDDFQKTWDDESIEINSKNVADKRLANVHTKDVESRKDEARHTIIGDILRGIETYEKESARVVQQLEQRIAGAPCPGLILCRRFPHAGRCAQLLHDASRLFFVGFDAAQNVPMMVCRASSLRDSTSLVWTLASRLSATFLELISMDSSSHVFWKSSSRSFWLAWLAASVPNSSMPLISQFCSRPFLDMLVLPAMAILSVMISLAWILRGAPRGAGEEGPAVGIPASSSTFTPILVGGPPSG